jgi:hypothetical protein
LNREGPLLAEGGRTAQHWDGFQPQSASETASPAVRLTALETSALVDAKDREIIHLRCQVTCFQQQIFGQKSERRKPEPEGVQRTLG